MVLTPRVIDISEFARRVESLCDFFIAKKTNESGRDGSDDLKVLEDLKNDAADILHNKNVTTSETLSGLSEYMRKGTL